MIKTVLVFLWNRLSRLCSYIYEKILFLLFLQKETAYTILQIKEEDKYSSVKSAFKKQLFRYRSTVDKDNSIMTRKILESYNSIKKKELIYIDDDFFSDDFYKKVGECISNLENKNIVVNESNIRSIYAKYVHKYKKLIPYLKNKEMKMLVPNTYYLRKEDKTKKKSKIRKNKAFICQLCSKEYNHKNKYDEHMLGNKHRNKCKEMGISIKDDDDIQNHVKTEKKDTARKISAKISHSVPITMQKKEQKTTKADTFNEPHHFLICSFCSEKFSNRRQLILHLQQH